MPGNLGIFQGSPSAVSARNYSASEMTQVARKSLPMARELAQAGHEEMLELATKSTDIHHRVAAAWAFGLTKKHDCGLTALLGDQDPLVVLAAREACSHIAREKYGAKCVDFGPFPGTGTTERSHSRELWEMWFEKRAETLAKTEKAKGAQPQPAGKSPKPEAGKTVEKLGAGQRDVYDILGLDRTKD